MNTLLRMYCDIANRDDASAFIKSIKSEETLASLQAATVDGNSDMFAYAALLQIETLPLKSYETHVDGLNEHWQFDLLGWSTVTTWFTVEAGSALSIALHAAARKNMESNFRKVELYLRSDRFKSFRTRILKKIDKKAWEYSEDYWDASQKSVIRVQKEVEGRERFQKSTYRLGRKTNAVGVPLSWHHICEMVLRKLFDHGFIGGGAV